MDDEMQFPKEGFRVLGTEYTAERTGDPLTVTVYHNGSTTGRNVAVPGVYRSSKLTEIVDDLTFKQRVVSAFEPNRMGEYAQEMARIKRARGRR